MKGPPSNPQQSAVVLAMTDEDVVRRAALLLEAHCLALPLRDVRHKPVFVTRVRGRRAVEVMEAIRPYMGERRSDQITQALASRTLSAKRIPYATEVVALADQKLHGVHRRSLAIEYGITPKTVNKLARGAGRPLAEMAAAAHLIECAEAMIADAVQDSAEQAWLVGLAEGEVGFSRTGLALGMIDQDVVERYASLVGGRVRKKIPRNSNHSPLWICTVGRRKALAAIGHLGPAFGVRRQGQLIAIEALSSQSLQPGQTRPVSKRGYVPPERLRRNLEIAQRLNNGESGPTLAEEYGVTHQNIYYIRKMYTDAAACLSG